MSRQVRLVLVLSGLTLIGILALGGIAQRYASLQSNRGETAREISGDAERQVEIFVRARRMLRTGLAGQDFAKIDPDARELAFAAQRDRVLTVLRMNPQDYVRVRDHYRRWLRLPARADPAWRAVLDRQRDSLVACGLGEWEALDR